MNADWHTVVEVVVDWRRGFGGTHTTPQKNTTNFIYLKIVALCVMYILPIFCNMLIIKFQGVVY